MEEEDKCVVIMESRLNYTIVGLFVALLLGGLIIFIYWLSQLSGSQQYDYYHVYMMESVSGLSTDASVKYLGVDVGTVTYIDINPKNSEQVALLLKIKEGIPIKVDTTATLRFYGVTGLAFIELTGGGKNLPLLKKIQEDIPVIKANPSTFSNIEKSLNTVASKSTIVLDKIDRLLSDNNLKNVDEILFETKLMIQEIRGQQQRVESLIENGIAIEKSIDESFQMVAAAANSVEKMADSLAENGDVMELQFDNTLGEIESASNSIESMAVTLVHNYADIGPEVGQEVKQSLALFRQLLYQMDILVVDMQRTARSIEDSPSDLLFKSSQPKLGPGEEINNGK